MVCFNYFSPVSLSGQNEFFSTGIFVFFWLNSDKWKFRYKNCYFQGNPPTRLKTTSFTAFTVVRFIVFHNSYIFQKMPKSSPDRKLYTAISLSKYFPTGSTWTINSHLLLYV